MRGAVDAPRQFPRDPRSQNTRTTKNKGSQHRTQLQDDDNDDEMYDGGALGTEKEKIIFETIHDDSPSPTRPEPRNQNQKKKGHNLDYEDEEEEFWDASPYKHVPSGLYAKSKRMKARQARRKRELQNNMKTKKL